MASSRRPSTHPNISNPSEGPDRLDLVTFQSELDDSLSFAKALVQSWIPSHVDSSWTRHGDTGLNGTSFASRSRPARLGLGASITVLHQQQAEERKLRQQLLGHTKNRRNQAKDDITTPASPQTHGKMVVDSSDEEEESRSGAIKSRSRIASISNSIPPLKGAVPTSSIVSNGHHDPSSASSSMGKALFNPPSSSAPNSPVKSPLKQTVSTWSFYNASTSSSTETGGTKLTKNQRKKEREREKKEMMKRKALEEIAREERDSDSEEGDAVDDLRRSLAGTKKRKMEGGDGKKMTKVPFAPPPGTSSPALVNGDRGQTAIEDDEDAASEQSDGAGSIATTASNYNNEEGAGGEGGAKKKKQRRKKKGKVAAAKERANASVLNLAK